MTATPVVRCHILDTGHCLVPEHRVLQSGRRAVVAWHSLVALLEHPTAGWLLWDTGYAPRMWAATRGWPFWLYRLATPLRIGPELAVVNQLARFGLTPGDVRRVIVSHFHADHVAGLRDFPAAEVIVAREAYHDTVGRRGLRALQRAVLPALLPEDLGGRVRLVSRPTGAPLPGLGPTHDLLGDGSLQLVQLPGHAKGMLGLLAATERGPIFFAADGAWSNEAIREGWLPTRSAELIADDPVAVRATLHRLQEFATACPEVRLVPTHCPEAYASEVGR